MTEHHPDRVHDETVITEEGAFPVEITEATLGYEPYILLRCIEVDELGGMQFGVTIGGGIGQQQAMEILTALAADLPREADASERGSLSEELLYDLWTRADDSSPWVCSADGVDRELASEIITSVRAETSTQIEATLHGERPE